MKAEEFYLQRAVWGEGFPESDEPSDEPRASLRVMNPKQIYIDKGRVYVP